MVGSSNESSSYAAVGASSAKAGVLKAAGLEAEARYFAEPVTDFCGDPNYVSFLHADGAGTKSIIAYLAHREGAPASIFRGLAYDSLVMNLDDLACAGAFESLALSNTIGRNRSLISDDIIAELIAGYKECVQTLKSLGIEVALSGGETADAGDLIRTIVIDSCMHARAKRKDLIDSRRVSDGDVIVGLSSTGKASFETRENSGIGSNGLSLARHTLLSNHYLQKYSEIGDPNLSPQLAYRGPYKLSDTPTGLGMSIGEALLSPTRPYGPVIQRIQQKIGENLHAAVHCTGGGQSKIKRFGKEKAYLKDSLFEIPPIFKLIQEAANIPWNEMYAVFNMGHRIELVVPAIYSQDVVGIASDFGIAAQVIGRVTSKEGPNEVILHSPHGVFHY